MACVWLAGMQGWLELSRLALHALGTCCSRSPSLVLADDVTSIMQTLVSILQACCMPGAPLVEDAVHSRFYATLLRSLGATMASAVVWGGSCLHVPACGSA